MISDWVPTPKAGLHSLLAAPSLPDSNLGSKEWGKGFSTHLLPGLKRMCSMLYGSNTIARVLQGRARLRLIDI